MTVEIVEVVRNANSNNTTRITFIRDGDTFQFEAGRHTGMARIKSLAKTLQLTPVEVDTP